MVRLHSQALFSIRSGQHLAAPSSSPTLDQAQGYLDVTNTML